MIVWMESGSTQEPMFSKSEPTFTHANLHQPLKFENLPAKFKHPIMCVSSKAKGNRNDCLVLAQIDLSISL